MKPWPVLAALPIFINKKSHKVYFFIRRKNLRGFFKCICALQLTAELIVFYLSGIIVLHSTERLLSSGLITIDCIPCSSYSCQLFLRNLFPVLRLSGLVRGIQYGSYFLGNRGEVKRFLNEAVASPTHDLFGLAVH